MELKTAYVLKAQSASTRKKVNANPARINPLEATLLSEEPLGNVCRKISQTTRKLRGRPTASLIQKTLRKLAGARTAMAGKCDGTQHNPKNVKEEISVRAPHAFAQQTPHQAQLQRKTNKYNSE